MEGEDKKKEQGRGSIIKKSIGIILAILLVASLAGVTYLQVSYTNERLYGESIGMAATEQYVKSSATLAALSDSYQAEIIAHQTATDMVGASAETIDKINSINTGLRADLDRANEIAACPNLPDSIDYSSNRAVSNSLKAWIEEAESIHTAEWEAVWNNSKTSIHNLTGEHLFVFIVYFDEDDELNYKNSIYSVGQACFIDY